MKQPEPASEILSRIEATLRSGRTVFIIGALPAADSAPAARDITEETLRSEVATFLRQRVQSSKQIPVTDEPLSVYEFENLPLFSGSGWR